MTKKVGVFVVGAQKGGTTFLYQAMDYHPQVAVSYVKEISFFADPRTETVPYSMYEDYFTAGTAQDDLVQVDVSPQYSLQPKYSAKRIHAYNNNAIVLFIARDPASRFISHYLMSKRRGVETRSFSEVVESEFASRTKNDCSEGVADHLCYLEYSNYRGILSEYQKLFPGRVFVIKQEDLLNNPLDSLIHIEDRLGLKPIDWPKRVLRPVHVGGRELVPGLEKWLRSQSTIKTLFRWALGKRLYSRLSFQAKTNWLIVSKNGHVPISDACAAELRKKLHPIYEYMRKEFGIEW